jgi:alpha-tubulin suppressor-like RCC1 family protein
MPPADVDVGGQVTALSLGDNYSCALLESGGVRCWGSGSQGRLGNGSNQNFGDDPGEMPPVDINLGGPVLRLGDGGAGSGHTCVIRDDNTARCWGVNDFGQLGYGNTNFLGLNLNQFPPAPLALGGAVARIATGYQHTCAILQSGAYKCWGRNQDGQLGYGHTNSIGDQLNEMPPPTVPVGF